MRRIVLGVETTASLFDIILSFGTCCTTLSKTFEKVVVRDFSIDTLLNQLLPSAGANADGLGIAHWNDI